METKEEISMPTLVKAALNRNDKDYSWLWLWAKPEERAEVDAYLVKNSHRLAFEPMTSEQRFVQFVKEIRSI